MADDPDTPDTIATWAFALAFAVFMEINLLLIFIGLAEGGAGVVRILLVVLAFTLVFVVLGLVLARRLHTYHVGKQTLDAG